MVPNCIFLHLFHISRSTGFLKKKKNNRRRKEKKHSIHKWNESIKKQCGVVAASLQPVYLAPNLISLLVLIFPQILPFKRKCLLKPHVKQNRFLSLYPAFHNTSCIIPLSSPHLPRNISSWGQGLCFSVQDCSPSLQKSAWLLVSIQKNFVNK